MAISASVNADMASLSVPDYRLIQVIGRGTFGEVWLAEELLTGLHRAVKVLHKTPPTGAPSPLR
jgi:serine/threonine protein kinase